MNLENISEQDLLDGCRRKERRIQELLYKKYARKMLGLCLSYAKNNVTAKEILQEGFIKVFNNINVFEGKGSLEGWIRRIMVNTAINHYRQRAARFNFVSLDEILFISAEQIEDEILTVVTDKDLLLLIQQLPDKCRLVLNLYALEGYSHENIAKELSITVGTSKSQLNYARKKLKEKINLVYNGFKIQIAQ